MQHHISYAYRGEELEHLSLYEYMALVQVEKMTEDQEDPLKGSSSQSSSSSAITSLATPSQWMSVPMLVFLLFFWRTWKTNENYCVPRSPPKKLLKKASAQKLYGVNFKFTKTKTYLKCPLRTSSWVHLTIYRWKEKTYWNINFFPKTFISFFCTLFT